MTESETYNHVYVRKYLERTFKQIKVAQRFDFTKLLTLRRIAIHPPPALSPPTRFKTVSWIRDHPLFVLFFHPPTYYRHRCFNRK